MTIEQIAEKTKELEKMLSDYATEHDDVYGIRIFKGDKPVILIDKFVSTEDADSTIECYNSLVCVKVIDGITYHSIYRKEKL